MAGFIGIDPMIIERDYVLGCFISFLSTQHSVKESWIFKGGTSLRKCYFKDYRFSEDVDFTITSFFSVDTLLDLIKNVNAIMQETIGIVTNEREISIETVKDDYSAESFEVKFYYRGPWIFRGTAPAVQIHLSRDEKVVFSKNCLPVIHPYSDKSKLPQEFIPVYSLEEIFIEKLRAFSAQRKYAISRDIYDIHQISQKIKSLENLRKAFEEKCRAKGIQLNQIDIDKIIERKPDYEMNWKNNLDYLLPRSIKSTFEDAWSNTIGILGRILSESEYEMGKI